MSARRKPSVRRRPRVTFSISKENAVAIRALSEATGRPMSQIFHDAIEAHFTWLLLQAQGVNGARPAALRAGSVHEIVTACRLGIGQGVVKIYEVLCEHERAVRADERRGKS